MKSAATRTPAERQALNEAARWHTRLHDEAATPEDLQAWQQWHSAHPSHQWAWQTVQAVSQRLARIPTPVAMQALAQPPMARRAALRGVALGLGGCAATWLAWQASPWQALGASYHTATGERQQLGLPDGSELALDTATAVDEHFDANDRRLSLRSGRIQITTRPDLHQRPFSVQTPQGSVLALGTQFTVQVLDAQHTRVAVQEKSVRVQPTHGEARLLVAGQQMDFSSTEALPPSTGPSGAGQLARRRADRPGHAAGRVGARAGPLPPRLSGLRARSGPPAGVWRFYAGRHRPSAGRPGRQLCRAGALPHALLGAGGGCVKGPRAKGPEGLSPTPLATALPA